MRRFFLIPLLLIAFPAVAEEGATEGALRPGRQALAGLRDPVLPISPAEKEKRRGDFWLMMRRFRQAMEHFKKALALDPKHLQARLRLAFCLHQAGELDEALKELARVLEQDPKVLQAYVGIAEIELSRKRHEEAESALRKALAIAPGNPQILLRIGRSLRLRAEAGGDGAEALKSKAIAELEAAEKTARPGSPLAREVQRELLLVRHGKAGELLLAARDAVARGDGVGALKTLGELIAQKPDLAEAHYLRGKALSLPRVNKLAEAVAAFQQAKGMKEALLAIGEIHYEKGDMEEAETWFKKAIELDPRYSDAHYQLGLVYKELGEYERAVGAWREVVKIDPRSRKASWAATKIQILTGLVKGLAEGEVLDPSAERHLGQKFMELVERKWGILQDDALQARLDAIARKLVAMSDRSAENLRYEIRLVKGPAVNAVTFPGGKIAIFQGMIDLIQKELDDSDDAWAAVLGHEIAHAALRHGVTKAKVLSAQIAMEGNFGAVLPIQKFLTGFSRANEFEADQFGALYAYRAGYKPAAGLRLHERMLARREIPEGLGHPPHRERIERLREYLLELRAKTRNFHHGLKALEKGEYARAVHHFEVFLGVFPGSLAARNNLGLALHRKALLRIPAGHYKKSSDVDPSARIPPIALRSAPGSAARDEKAAAPVIDRPVLREAIAELLLVLKSDPSHVPAHVNLGAALLDLGERDKAVEHFKAALGLDPENAQALGNLAVAHLEAGENRQGMQILRKLAASDPPPADALYNLAVAHDRAGDKKRAAELYGRYLELDKDSGWAKNARERLAALRP
jgi:tetratricopeptide (TPR) repeat protein